MNSDLRLMRSLIRMLKTTSGWKTVKDKTIVQYILNESREHRETSEIVCKARTELKSLAENYLLYLVSQQKCQQIKEQYSGKGERDVQEIADIVGFKLPNNRK